MKIALTGTGSVLGRNLLLRLRRKEGVSIICLDSVPPAVTGKNIKYFKIDLLDPAVHFTAGEILEKEKPSVFLHFAVTSTPSDDPEKDHELNVIGTMKVLHACRIAGVKRLIYKSSAFVYGAHPDHPAILTENLKFRETQLPFVKDKREAEEMILNFQKNVEGAQCTILRFGFILDPEGLSFFTKYLRMKPVPVVAGYSPVIQLLHIDDAVNLLEHIIFKKKVSGIFNVAGEGLIPLRKAIRLAGSIPLPLIKPLAEAYVNTLWNISLAPFPGEFLNFFVYPFILDTSRMKKELKFTPVYDSMQTLKKTRKK